MPATASSANGVKISVVRVSVVFKPVFGVLMVE